MQHDTEVKFTNDPIEAVQRAHVVVTDTWVSMGQEEEKERKLEDFAGYQVTRKVGGRREMAFTALISTCGQFDACGEKH